MKIYTKTGDRGQTGLLRGMRVAKDDERIEAIGTVDELSSAVGIARATALPADVDAILAQVQDQLFSLGAELATPDATGPSAAGIQPDVIHWIEKQIDVMDETLPPLQTFILPAGAPLAAHLHHARAVCRRAERRCVTLGRGAQVCSGVVVYLNRLSDLLFVLARVANAREGTPDVPWRPGTEPRDRT